MNYFEAKPSEILVPFIKCFWALEDERPGLGDEPEPVIPDGCVEIVFNLSDRFRRYADDGSFETQPAALVVGQMDRRVVIGPSGNVRLFGIRFQPAGAAPFFGFSMSELSGRIEPLDGVWGNAVGELVERLFDATSFRERTAVASSYLIKIFTPARSEDVGLGRSINAIKEHSGKLRISKLAREMGVGERGLERRFRESVGLSPKAFSRIIRFQSVLKSIERSAKPDLASISHELGYFDQSHFIGDFQRFAGMTPAAYLSADNRITDIFIPE